MNERQATATAVIWLREAAKLPNAQPCRLQIEEAMGLLNDSLSRPRPDEICAPAPEAEPCGEWCDACPEATQ